MPPAHARIVLAVDREVAKIAPPFDYLLGRTAADSQLQSPASDQIRSASVFRHGMRVLIPHVDHCGAKFNLVRPGTDCSEQREGGCQLLREVMNAEVSPIYSQALSLNREINGLQQRVGC